MATLKRILIKFDKYSMPYAPDEVAGFSAERAALYVKHGIGHYCDQDGKPSRSPVVFEYEPPSIRSMLTAEAATLKELARRADEMAKSAA